VDSARPFEDNFNSKNEKGLGSDQSKLLAQPSHRFIKQLLGWRHVMPVLFAEMLAA
jgi:hypothetical protein